MICEACKQGRHGDCKACTCQHRIIDEKPQTETLFGGYGDDATEQFTGQGMGEEKE